MCIGSNWVNEAQDLMYVTKFCNLPNKQDPKAHHWRRKWKKRWDETQSQGWCRGTCSWLSGAHNALGQFFRWRPTISLDRGRRQGGQPTKCEQRQAQSCGARQAIKSQGMEILLVLFWDLQFLPRLISNKIAELYSRDIRVQQGAALVSDLMCQGQGWMATMQNFNWTRSVSEDFQYLIKYLSSGLGLTLQG